MSCFPCFSSQRSIKNSNSTELLVAHATGPDIDASLSPPANGKQKPSAEVTNKDEANTIDTKNISAHMFTFRELAAATKNFRQECLLGEGGFGRVYHGTLQPSGQVVAVKKLDRTGMQGNKEFLVEVSMLSLLNHPNLANLVGYCADGDQRLLVYEYMPCGSVEDHVLGISGDKKPLDWIARMKIAAGAAEGLEYLHEKANPPVMFRDMKSSNILLDEELNPRLCNYGVAKLGVGKNKMLVSPRVMGTYGYCAPEYERTGELTLKSDVYSFGVVLLELITGRRAIDTTRQPEEQNLVSWAQPFFRDPKRFPDMADPILERKFPVKSLNQAIGVAAMCVQEEPSVRPIISDVVAALSFLAVAAPDEHALRPVPDQPSLVEVSSPPEEERDIMKSSEQEQDCDSDSDCTGNSSDGDGDGVEDRRDQDNSEMQQAQVKKSVKWASRCKSKGDDQDGSVRPISNHDSNADPESNGSVRSISSHDSNDDESRVEGSSQVLNSNSSLKWGSDSRESIDGSADLTSSSETSDDESVDGRSSNISRSSRDADPKYGSYGSNSRQDSDLGSRDGSSVFGLRRFSNVDSQDGSVGLNSTRNSYVESHDGSLRSDSSSNGSSRHDGNVRNEHEHENALS